jgi:hypothetical protein
MSALGEWAYAVLCEVAETYQFVTSIFCTYLSMSLYSFRTHTLTGTLILAFLMQPLGVVFAQQSSTTALSGSTTASGAPLIVDSNVAPITPQAMSAASGGESGGEGRGMSSIQSVGDDQFLVSPSDGSSAYEIPIATPPGRNGLAPSVRLSYSSNAVGDDNFAGYGWNVDIPYIKRQNKFGSNNLYLASTTVYYSSQGGELVQVGTTNEYKPRTETGDFSKYTLLASGAWSVTDKLGTRYTFGSTTASRHTCF